MPLHDPAGWICPKCLVLAEGEECWHCGRPRPKGTDLRPKPKKKKGEKR